MTHLYKHTIKIVLRKWCTRSDRQRERKSGHDIKQILLCPCRITLSLHVRPININISVNQLLESVLVHNMQIYAHLCNLSYFMGDFYKMSFYGIFVQMDLAQIAPRIATFIVCNLQDPKSYKISQIQNCNNLSEIYMQCLHFSKEN